MSDKELEEYIKKVEPNFNSHIEKGTIEMSNEYYNLLEERIRRLIDENNQLKEKYEKQQYAITENCDLRLEIEQLEENNQAMQEEMCRTWEKLNIIKELRSWLKDFADYSDCIKIISVLNKLNELEGKNGMVN